jgi:hypothetical protein
MYTRVLFILLTVVIMQCDSLTAPQHPKNEIMKMQLPTTMSKIAGMVT